MVRVKIWVFTHVLPFRHGFNTPILVKEKSGLGISVPDSDFTVSDVKNYVGAKRIVDIMDCSTQKNSEMTMKDWEEYYTSPNRTRKLNVISLEFSFTKLESLVEAPRIVRQIDWTDNVWPRHLKEQQTEVRWLSFVFFQCTITYLMIILLQFNSKFWWFFAWTFLIIELPKLNFRA